MWFYSGISMTLSSRDSFSESNTLFTCFQIFRSSPPPIDLFFRSFLGWDSGTKLRFSGGTTMTTLYTQRSFNSHEHLYSTQPCFTIYTSLLTSKSISLNLSHHFPSQKKTWHLSTSSTFHNTPKPTPQNPSSFSNKSSFLHKVYISTRIQQQLHRLHVAWSIRSSGEK